MDGAARQVAARMAAAAAANHAHSAWRDPTADFGYDVLGAHLAEHHPV